MGRPKIYVKVKFHDGKPYHVPKPPKEASETDKRNYETAEPIIGLHYHPATKRFYRLVANPDTRKSDRDHIGYNLQDAIAKIRQHDPTATDTTDLLTAKGNLNLTLQELMRRHQSGEIGIVDDEGKDALEFIREILKSAPKPPTSFPSPRRRGNQQEEPLNHSDLTLITGGT